MTADVPTHARVCVQAVASSRAGWDLARPKLSSTNSSKFIGTLGGTIPETGKKRPMTLTAHYFFYNCSVKIILCSSCSLIYVLYK